MPDPAPVRLQLSRAKGFDLQALSLATNGLQAVKVDRSTKWGNPWRAGDDDCATAEEAVALFRQRELAFASMVPARHAREMDRLRGRNIACWCALPKPGEPDICHGSVLLALANRPACEAVG